jgi:hypothetical protein
MHVHISAPPPPVDDDAIYTSDAALHVPANPDPVFEQYPAVDDGHTHTEEQSARATRGSQQKRQKLNTAKKSDMTLAAQGIISTSPFDSATANTHAAAAREDAHANGHAHSLKNAALKQQDHEAAHTQKFGHSDNLELGPGIESWGMTDQYVPTGAGASTQKPKQSQDAKRQEPPQANSQTRSSTNSRQRSSLPATSASTKGLHAPTRSSASHAAPSHMHGDVRERALICFQHCVHLGLCDRCFYGESFSREILFA